MNADQRLDQLEPIFSQQLAVMDQVTAQQSRHTTQLKIITNAIAAQSDNIAFLLRETSEIKAKQELMQTDISGLKLDVSTLKLDVSTLKLDVSTLKLDVSTLKSDVSTLKSDVSEIKGTLNLILERLS